MDNFDPSTLANLSREELLNEYVTFKMQNQVLTTQLEKSEQKLEETQQHLYETKRQLVTLKAMESDMASEIELLQQDNKDQISKMSQNILCLEEKASEVKQQNLEKIENYEQKLKEKEVEIIELDEKYKILSKNVDEIGKNDIIGQYTEEIFELKSKLEAMSTILAEKENQNDDLVKQNISLENRVVELSTNLEEISECLKSKNEELQTNDERVENLQDELMIIQMELDKYKNVPLEKGAKGNSLFAEVHDSRQQLVSYIQALNKKYKYMKSTYAKKCWDMDELHIAYAILKQAVEDKCDFKYDQDKISTEYKKYTDKLMENIKALENELLLRDQATKKILSGDQKITESLIETTRKEILNIRNDLRIEQIRRMQSEDELYDANVQQKIWRLEALSLRTEKLILEQKIEQLLAKEDIEDLQIVSPEENDDSIKKQWMLTVHDIEEDNKPKLNKNPSLPTEHAIKTKRLTVSRLKHNSDKIACQNNSVKNIDNTDSKLKENDLKCNEQEELAKVNLAKLKIDEKEEAKENFEKKTEDIEPGKITENVGNESKKVTFAVETVEPLKSAKRRFLVPKNILHIPSIHK